MSYARPAGVLLAIEWNNPRLSGLVGCFVSDGTRMINLVGDIPMSKSGAVTYNSDHTYYADTGYTYTVDSAPFKLSGDVTLVSIAQNASNTTDGNICLFSTNGETSSTNAQYTLNVVAGKLKMFWEYGNGTNKDTSADLPVDIVPNAAPNCYGATRSVDTTSDVSFFVNGGHIGDSLGNTNPSGGGSAGFSIGALKGNSAYSQYRGDVHLVLVFNETKSQEDMESLTATPWQALQSDSANIEQLITSAEQSVFGGSISQSQRQELQTSSAENSVQTSSVSLSQIIALQNNSAQHDVIASYASLEKQLEFITSSAHQVVEMVPASLIQGKTLPINGAQQSVEVTSTELSKQSLLAQNGAEHDVIANPINLIADGSMIQTSAEHVVQSLSLSLTKQQELATNSAEHSVISSSVLVSDQAIFVLHDSVQEVISTSVDINQLKTWLVNSAEQSLESQSVTAIEIKELVGVSAQHIVEGGFFIRSGSMPDIDIDNVRIISLTKKHVIKSITPQFIIN